MYLPEQLQEQSFMTWNHTVKGLMRVWEIANKLGLERALEARLADDVDCSVVLRIAEVGNDPRRLAQMYRDCVAATRTEEDNSSREPLYGVIVINEEYRRGTRVAA